MVACAIPAMRASPFGESGTASKRKQLGVVHDFRARLIGEPLAQHGQHSVVDIIGRKSRRPGLHRYFDPLDLRAKTLFVRVFRIEREPDGRFVAARNRIEKRFQRRG